MQLAAADSRVPVPGIIVAETDDCIPFVSSKPGTSISTKVCYGSGAGSLGADSIDEPRDERASEGFA
jgi:hypothetical protein